MDTPAPAHPPSPMEAADDGDSSNALLFTFNNSNNSNNGMGGDLSQLSARTVTTTTVTTTTVTTYPPVKLPRMNAARLSADMYPLAHVAAPPALEQFAVEMDGQQLYFSQQHGDSEEYQRHDDVPRAMTPLYTHDDARQQAQQAQQAQQQHQHQHQHLGASHRRSSSPPAAARRAGGRGSASPKRRTGGDDDLAGGGLGAVYSLPALVSTYDGLPEPVQAYLLFQLLRRTPRATLQFAAQTVLPVLHRDFIGSLPPEVAHHVLRFMDARSLCRAACVSSTWRAVVDANRAVWRARLADARYVPEPSRVHALCLPHFGLGRAPGEPPGLARLAEPELSVAQLAPRPATAGAVARARDALLRAAAARDCGNPFKARFARGYALDRRWADGRARHLSLACTLGTVVTCVEMTDTHVVAGLDTRDILVFDLATGAVVRRLAGHEGGVWALSVVGSTVVSGSTDRTVRVWDLDDGRCTHVFTGQASTVRCLHVLLPSDVRTPHERASGAPPRFEPSEPMIVAGSRDTTLKVWRLPSPRHDAPYAPAAAQAQVAQQQVAQQQLQQQPQQPQQPQPQPQLQQPERMAVDDDDDNDDDGPSPLQEPAPSSEPPPPRSNPYYIRTLSGHSDSVRTVTGFGNMVVSGSYDGSVRVWDAVTGALRHQLTGHTSKVYALVLDTDMHLIFSGSMDGFIRVWDWDSGMCLRILRGHLTLVGLLGLDHSALVSAGADQTLRIWDHPIRASPSTPNDSQQVMRPRPFSSIAGDLVPPTIPTQTTAPLLHHLGANPMFANHIAALAAANPQQIHILQQLQLQQRANDQLLYQQLNNSGDHATDLLRTDRAVLRGHTTAITCFQHDGTKIVSGADNTVKLWDVRTGLFVRDLLSNLSSVWQVRFDARRCVAAVNRNETTYFDIMDFDI